MATRAISFEMLQEIGLRAKAEKGKIRPGRPCRRSPMKGITYYSKPDCPLCDESYPKVARLAARHGLVVTRVNIETDSVLFERHKHRIPVVELAGRELAWGRISERGLERELRKALRDGGFT